MSGDESVVVCLSGRGDKDVASVAQYRGGLAGKKK
jgi:tryptophan synthase beta subunit